MIYLAHGVIWIRATDTYNKPVIKTLMHYSANSIDTHYSTTSQKYSYLLPFDMILRIPKEYFEKTSKILFAGILL
jgi:hypothetical protein